MPTETLLFSYGTLQLPAVQQALFGRAVACSDDVLRGFALGWVEIADPSVVATSGSDRHPIVRRDAPDGEVSGVVLALSDAELDAVDRYETDDYVRISVTLASGRTALVYAAADGCEGRSA